jgi:hypothetical protein
MMKEKERKMRQCGDGIEIVGQREREKKTRQTKRRHVFSTARTRTR